MDNVITIAGNVGTAVDYKSGEGSTGKWANAKFRLVSTRRAFRNGAWADMESTWVTVLCWKHLADGVRDSINKGEPVVVVGRLHHDQWIDKNGEVHSTMVVKAESVGHDLSRGRACFVRNSRVPTPESRDEEAVASEPPAGLPAVPDVQAAAHDFSLQEDPFDDDFEPDDDDEREHESDDALVGAQP